MQPHSLAKLFWSKLIRFGQIWLDLGKIKAKFGQNWSKMWAKSNYFGKFDWIWQYQNLASPKTFDLIWLCYWAFAFEAVLCFLVIWTLDWCSRLGFLFQV